MQRHGIPERYISLQPERKVERGSAKIKKKKKKAFEDVTHVTRMPLSTVSSPPNSLFMFESIRKECLQSDNVLTGKQEGLFRISKDSLNPAIEIHTLYYGTIQYGCCGNLFSQ